VRCMRAYVLQVNEQNLEELAASCAEFLVHGVDVEGMQLGVDEELIHLLGASTPVPMTYAGGVQSMARTLESARGVRAQSELLHLQLSLHASISFGVNAIRRKCE
jgi:phosphoribosylformimino-5-aminoimidazole carboxamide ribotide isomerase